MAALRKLAKPPAALIVLLVAILESTSLFTAPAPVGAFPEPAQVGHWQLQLTNLWANREDETDDEPYLVVIGFVSQLGVQGSTRIIYERPFEHLNEQSYDGGDAERAAIPSWMGVIDFGQIETPDNRTIVGAVIIAMEHDGTPWQHVRTVFDSAPDEVRSRLRPIEAGTLAIGGGGGGSGSTPITAQIGNLLKDIFDSDAIRLVSLGRDGDDVVGVQILAWHEIVEPLSPLGCPDRPWEIGTIPALIMPLRETTFDRPDVSANACNSLRFSGKKLPDSPAPAIGDSDAFYEVNGRMTSITPRAGGLAEPRGGSSHIGKVDLGVRLCGGCHKVTAVRYFATYDRGDGTGPRERLLAWGDPNRGWAATWDITGLPQQVVSVRGEMSTSVGWALDTHTNITLNRDSTPPSGQITSPTNGAVHGGSVHITAQVTDDLSGVDRVDFWRQTTAGRQAIGRGTPATTPANSYSADWSSGSTNGTVTIGGTAFDKQGNSADLPGVTVTIDNLPPTVTSAYPSATHPTWITSRNDVQLRATASDPGGAVREVRFTAFYKDGAGRSVQQSVGAATAPDALGFYTVAWDVSGIPDQVDRTAPYDAFVVVTAIDRAGNSSPLTNSSGGSFLGFDRAAPDLRIVSPSTWVATRAASFPIEVTATDVLGVSNQVARLIVTARYREPGAAQPTPHTLATLTNVSGWTGSLSLASLPEQTVTIAAEATDEAGNVSTRSANIAIDRTAPVIGGTSFSPNPFLANGTRTVSVSYQLAEPAPQVELSFINSAGATVKVLPFANVNTDPRVAIWDGRDSNGSLVTSGSYTYRIQATDAAGNTGSYLGGPITVTVDTTPPVISVVLTPNPFVLSSGGSLNIRYQQNEPARAEIEILTSAGQVIRYLGGWQENAGIYNRAWDGTNAAGVRVVAPASYTVRLRVTDQAGNVATTTAPVSVQP